ncbi:MAG: hypothetical protein ABW123_17385 [Cystobacter sp.]
MAWRGFWLGLMLVAGCQSPTGLKPSVETSREAGSGTCLKEGEGASSYSRQHDAAEALPEQPCCPGLTRLESYEASSVPRQCLLSKGGRYVCTHCGDGQCREGENTCNCPTDCP